jgi:hypothetical protein
MTVMRILKMVVKPPSTQMPTVELVETPVIRELRPARTTPAQTSPVMQEKGTVIPTLLTDVRRISPQ